MELRLTTNCLYEFAFLEAQITGDGLDAYLGPVADEARAAGALVKGVLEVTHLEHSDFDANCVIVVEWPSPEIYATVHGRPSWPTETLMGKRAFPVTVGETVTLKLEATGRYEFAAFWMNRQNAGLNAEYFAAMGDLIKAAAPRPLASFKAADPVGPLALAPDRFNLLEWTGPAEAREAMFTSQAFKAEGYRRALAVDRLMTIMVRA